MAISPRLATNTLSNMGGGEVIDADPHNGDVRKAAALVAAAAVVLTLAAPAQAQLRFKRCGSFGYQCARLNVPLDHAGAVPGALSLFVRRIPARQRATRAPLIVLAGGPGQSATAAFGGDALAVVYPAYRNRDLVVFDQRGTGRSGVLRCRRLEQANLLRAGAEAGACARRLGARRGFYTSRDSVEDIELLRRGLGAEQLALFGTSYGTKVALGYALGHRRNVERLVLDSVVEAGGPDYLYLDSLSAVPRVLRALCRSGCRAFTRDPVADLERLVGRMSRAPLRGRIVGPSGRPRAAAMDRGDLFAVLLAGDFDPSLRGAFPGAVRSALAGDGAPLLRLRRRAFALDGILPPPRQLSAMLYTTTTCEETVFPWSRSTPPDPQLRRSQAAAAAAALPSRAFAPFDRETALDSDLIELCAGWPTAAPAPGFATGPEPDVPVLLIEGEDDLRTPVENARRVAAQFPRARLVVAPATGHSALGADGTGCTVRAFGRFLGGGRVQTDCRRIRREFPATPPPPAGIGAVEPIRGTGGRRGRVLTAVGLTLWDVLDDVLSEYIGDLGNPAVTRGVGLRAGRYGIDRRGTLRLRELTFVPGLRLTGRVAKYLERSQRGELRVSGGPGVPSGVLTLRGYRVSGRLGGRKVRGRLRQPVLVRLAESATARATAAIARQPSRD
jgi:pimeloyl-ACP methyl ester carboxylesterase